MTKLTKEELNGLSERARKADEDANGVLSEVLTQNPNIQITETEEAPKKKKEDYNEKL